MMAGDLMGLLRNGGGLRRVYVYGHAYVYVDVFIKEQILLETPTIKWKVSQSFNEQ